MIELLVTAVVFASAVIAGYIILDILNEFIDEED